MAFEYDQIVFKKERKKKEKNYKMHNCTSCDTLAVGVLIINDDYDHDYAAFNIVQYRIKITVRSQKKKKK